MKQPAQVDSPFMKAEPLRLGFRTIILMLLMVVGAGIGMLAYHALRVPAITSEINAWLGRPNPVTDSTDARAAQVTFLLFVYSAPLVLGMLVYLLHFVINWLDRRSRSPDAESEEAFRME